MMSKEVKNELEMRSFGERIGAQLVGGEIIELIGDVGSGKTTLAKGIAVGLCVEDNVQSPSFTINRTYQGRDSLTLSHYDLYRLEYAGIIANELQESVGDPNTITIVEWPGVVDGALPVDRLTIKITSPSETSRELVLASGGVVSKALLEKIEP